MDSIERTAVSTAWVALDACARTLIFAALAAIAVRVLRISRPAARLQIWSVVLVCAVLMPGLTRGLPEWALPIPSWLAVATPVAPERVVPSVAANKRPPSDRSDATSAELPMTATAVAIPAAPPATLAVPWPIVAIAIYVSVLAMLLFQLFIAWRATRRLVRNAISIEDPAVVEQFHLCVQAAGLQTAPRLLETPALLVPITCGILRPSVVLPTNWRDWSAPALHAVFVHELAHVARRDAIRQMMSLIYRALRWINPFSWWLHRRLVDLAEQASDDAAMEAGADRIEYAEMLVGFFEAASANRSRRANWGVAMATGASVERRVERIINWSAAAKITSRVRVGLLLLMPIAALAASAMPGAAAVAPSVNEPPVERTVAVVASVPSEGTGVGTHTPAPSQPSVAAAPAMVAAAPGDPQMAVLLFDLAVPSDTRGRMIDAVRRQVAESRVRFDAGLELGHVSRVVAVGDQTSILQDFTGDPDKVDAALTRVAALTTSLADRSARIAAIGRVCREVSALPVTNAYFNDWPELYKKLQIGVRSPITLDSTSRRVDYFVAAEWLTPEERRRVQESCQFANLLYREVAVERTPGQASAARPMDPVGRHTALIFDGTLVERERERATALANQIIAELGPYEAISVVASGAAPEVVQDFTGDKSLLRGAVARAAALVAAPNSSAGWRSVRNTCASMTEVGPTSAAGLFALIERAGRLMLVFPGDQRVFYFSAAVERGVISPRDMRDIAADCSDVRRSFFVFDAGWISPVYGANGPVSTGLRQIGYDLGVGLDVAPRQPNCPLTLATEKTAFDNGYASVIVSNASQKTVGRVTLGLVLTPNDASQMVPTVLLAQGVSMPLQPGERIDIATRLLEGKLFALLARQGALVEVGVVAVDFTDGTKWTYDLQSRGRFERH